MPVSRRVSCATTILFGFIVWCLASPAFAEEVYPSKVIKLVVPFGAGGITDVVGRLIGQRLSEELKQSVVIENRPGAGGGIAAQSVAQSAPDGYTLLLGTVGTQVFNRMIYSNLSYDPETFVPVSLISNSPYVLAVAGLPGVRDLEGLATYARANPGKLNFGSAGHGSTPHLGLELFKLITKTDIVHVPFKSGPEAVNAALSGQVQVVFDAIPVIMPQVRDGRLEALAIADKSRNGATPELKSGAEQGMPDLQLSSWNAILAPANTPKERTELIASALVRVFARKDVTERLLVLGIEPLPVGLLAYEAHLQAEKQRWSRVMQAANVRVN